jgi:urease accessory protein
MLQTSKLLSQGAGLSPVLLKRATTVELDWDVRQKSRFDATDSAGRSLGIFLPRGTVVRGGDVLVAEDGSLIKVIAAPQAVLKITHCSTHGTPYDLIRAAYHLGNRHVPIELKPDHLKIEPDHVLADMLRAMHLIVNEVNEAFEPENGAYATGGHSHAGHGHDHHGHGHDLDHSHAHAPAAAKQKLAAIPIATAPAHSDDHAHGHAHDHGHAGHVHGPDCKHDH